MPIPAMVSNQLKSLWNNFLWKGSTSRHNGALVGCQKLSLFKKKGGLGYKGYRVVFKLGRKYGLVNIYL